LLNVLPGILIGGFFVLVLVIVLVLGPRSIQALPVRFCNGNCGGGQKTVLIRIAIHAQSMAA
jgi:hypothetical protein